MRSWRAWAHPDPLAGRAGDLTRLSEMRSAPGIVTVTGPGGVGKTRLVRALLREESDEQPVAVVELDYAALPGGLADAVARVFVGEAYSALDPISALVRVIRDESFLLVLDGFDPALHDVLFLVALHEQCVRLRTIVTSLRRLGTAGERLLALTPLALPSADDPWRSPSMQLLAECFARAGRPVDRDADTAALAEICRRAAGLPLALELVAGWAPVYGVADIASLVGSSLELFSGGGPDRPERQRDLRALIAQSVGHLSDRQRMVLAAVGAVPGGIEHRLLAEVCPDGVGADLRALVERHLVIGASRGRFDLLDPVRLFVEHEMADLVDANRTAFATIVADEVTAWGPRVGTTTTTAAVRRLAGLDALHGPIIRRLAARYDPRAVDIALGLTRYWMCTARINDGLEALDAADGETLEVRQRARLAIARTRLLNHAYDARAVAEGGRALTLALAVSVADDPSSELEARARLALGRALMVSGDEVASIEMLEQAARRRDALPAELVGLIDLDLGAAHYNLGAYEPSDAALGRALAAIGPGADLAARLDAAGLRLAIRVHERRDAGDPVGDAITVASQCDWPFPEIVRLRYWISVHLVAAGDIARAAQVIEPVMAEAERTGMIAAVGNAFLMLAQVKALVPNGGAQARHALRSAAELALTSASPVGAQPVLHAVVELAPELGIAGTDLRRLLSYALPLAPEGTEGLRGTIRLDSVTAAIRAASLTAAEVERLRATPVTRDFVMEALQWLRQVLEAGATPIAPVRDPRFKDISAREMEILHLVSLGKSDQDIADQLVVGLRTVNTHVLNIRRKLDAPNRRAAGAMYRAATGAG